MAVWQENLKTSLSQKEVIILHGNVRDTHYIRGNRTQISLMNGLSDLFRWLGKDLQFNRLIQWGVVFDAKGKSSHPMWGMERIEPLDGGESSIRSIGSQNPAATLLNRWLQKEIVDRTQRSIFVINYIDKLTPYSPRGVYPQDIAFLIVTIQKIIENIAPNNRLVMVALQDSLIPLDYYTNSPKVTVLKIPNPDFQERKSYFVHGLSDFPVEQLEFLADLTDGLYLRDLDNIAGAAREAREQYALSRYALRRLVNRYRIGVEEDPWAKLPLVDHQKALLDGSAERWFKSRVIGQDHAVEYVIKVIEKARAGVAGLATGQEAKPKGVFFFAGPTGVGKTFLAKKLAEFLFGTEDAFIRFDMSEFKEEHTISKLIGSPPGYVGYEEGGKLTNAVKERPFSVVLFDEIEKAHPRILDIFLQILDDGRLTDSRGQTVFFTETVIIFTSNVGTRTINSFNQPTNEKENLAGLEKISAPKERAHKIREHFVESVRRFFMEEISRPELLNRIGSHIVAFNYLDVEAAQKEIIRSKLKDIAENFKEKFSHLGHRLSFSDRVVDYFYQKHKDSISRLGGRGLVNAIDDELGYLLARQMLIAERHNLQGRTFAFDTNDEGDLLCRRR